MARIGAQPRRPPGRGGLTRGLGRAQLMIAAICVAQWVAGGSASPTEALMSATSLSPSPLSPDRLTTVAESGDTLAGGRALFTPRFDYNSKWLPVGRGDPLKNDPTYDYSPPVLDRVRYWGGIGDPSSGSSSASSAAGGVHPDSDNILLLGVPSKRPSTRKEYHYYKYSSPPARRVFQTAPATVLMPPPIVQPSHADAWHANVKPGAYNGGMPDAVPVEVMHSSRPKGPYGHPPIAAEFYTKPVQVSVEPFKTSTVPTNVEFVNYVDSSKHELGAFKTSVLKQILLKEAVVTTARPHFQMQYSPTFYESHSSQTMPMRSEMTSSTSALTTSTLPPSTDFGTSTHFAPTIPPPVVTAEEDAALFAPMYLIIEGHSKVKTYGLGNPSSAGEKHAPKIVPISSGEIDPVVRHVVSADEHGNDMTVVKHLHRTDADRLAAKAALELTPPHTSSPMDSLLSLLDTSFGNFLDQTSDESDSNTSAISAPSAPASAATSTTTGNQSSTEESRRRR